MRAMRSLSALFFASLLLAACGGARPAPAEARTTVVSLVQIDCASCGEQIVAGLRVKPGVYEATFDRGTAEVRVVASPGFDVFTAVRDGAAERGFDVILGAGKGHYLESPAFPEGADVRTVSTGGADVPSLEAILAPGKVTVVDFSAQWCGPCRAVDEHMGKVLAARRDVAYRRLDVGDWSTPLSKRYLKDIPKLPYVIVYGASGAKVTAISGVDLKALDAAIRAGAAP